jgi:hypothetical protein
MENIISFRGLKRVLQILLIIILLYFNTVICIDSWKNDEYNQVRIFKRIPQTIFWNFDK